MPDALNPYMVIKPHPSRRGVGVWAKRTDDGRFVAVNDPYSQPYTFSVGDRLLVVRPVPGGWANDVFDGAGMPDWAPDGDYDMDGGAYRLVVSGEGRIAATMVDESKLRK